MKRAILFFITVLSKVVILAQPVPIDYSYCGYRLSEVTIPEVPSVLYVMRFVII